MLAIEYRPIDSLKAYENNVKAHPADQIEGIKYSIQRFGMCDPIAVDKEGVIIEGHGRFEALKQLGVQEVPVIVLADLSEEQAKVYRLAHNSLALSTGIDVEQLYDELKTLGADYDLKTLDLPTDIDVSIDLFERAKDGEGEKRKKEIECPLCGGKFLK